MALTGMEGGGKVATVWRGTVHASPSSHDLITGVGLHSPHRMDPSGRNSSSRGRRRAARPGRCPPAAPVAPPPPWPSATAALGRSKGRSRQGWGRTVVDAGPGAAPPSACSWAVPAPLRDVRSDQWALVVQIDFTRAGYGPRPDVVQFEHHRGLHPGARVNWRGPAESAAGTHPLRRQQDPEARGAAESSQPRLRRRPVAVFRAVRTIVPVTDQAGPLGSSPVGRPGGRTPAFSVLHAMSRHDPPHSPYAGSLPLFWGFPDTGQLGPDARPWTDCSAARITPGRSNHGRWPHPGRISVSAPGMRAADATPCRGGIGLSAPNTKVVGMVMRPRWAAKVSRARWSWIDSHVPE